MPRLAVPRLSFLSNQFYLVFHLRHASTAASSSPHETNYRYPYPTHQRPTPHQIFHLPPDASQEDIKKRYYDLVRVHHPDSTQNPSLSPAERHARFQAITAAYDILRGKAPSFHSGFDPYREEVLRRKHFHQAHHERQAEYMHPGRDWAASSDDRWKDRLIVLVGLVTLVVGIIPGMFLFPSREKGHQSAASHLSMARSMAREHGEERRNGMRKQVEIIKTQRSDGGGHGDVEADRLKEPRDVD